MPALDQPLDQRDDLRHMAGGTRLVVGRRNAQLRRILVHGRDEPRGERIDATRRCSAARRMILSSMSVMLRT